VSVVDASVWVAWLVRQDVHHQASRDWLRQHVASGTQLAAPTIVLAELSAAIARRTGDRVLALRAVRGVLRVPGLRLLPVDRQLALLAAQSAADLGLRGADAVYVATAHHLGVPLVTLDREQQQRAARLVSVQSPN
jgi:predicted nucleic acid-binding protein